jgi:long-chain acyl-CoA synthetase
MFDSKTIPELFFARCRESAAKDALSFKRDGRWHAVSWSDYEAHVRSLARGMGDWVQPGDIVSILSDNRPEWCYSDLAALALGAITAPIFPSSPPKEIAYILNDCGARLLFLSTAAQLAKVRDLRAAGLLPRLERVVSFEEVQPEGDWLLPLSALHERGEAAPDPIAGRMASLGERDLATLIYTSGTTGEPKGVMLTHGNLVSNVAGGKVVIDDLGLDEKVMLSFLPLSHGLERTCGYYAAIAYEAKVAFAESIPKLIDNFAEVRPTLLVSVPRIYEKMYAGILQQASSPLRRRLLLWALDVGREHSRLKLAGKPIPGLLAAKHAVAARLVFSKVLAKLGGRLRYGISGGGPLAPEIAEFMMAFGFTIFEGYGLTETSPIVTGNKPGKIKIGSVGTPWTGVEVKIAPESDRERDGEVLVRGPNVMKGYYGKPVETANVLDGDGWFRTGDIGFIDGEGFLHITDRKKELIKTAGGKYVAPQPIENQLKVHPLIEQAVMIGDRRKYCVALLVPDFKALERALGRDLPSDLRRLNDDPQVRALLQTAVDQVNQELGGWEQIKRFVILPAELTEESGELTPSLKVKRRVVEEKFRAQIDALYP